MGSNKTIQIALCFMANECTESYQWALQQLNQLLILEEIELPELIVTDRDRALLNALEIVFPTVRSRICMWHMNKDVHAWIRQRFGVIKASSSKELEDTEAGKMFWDKYRETIESSTLEGFMTGCESLEAMSLDGWRYLWTTWFKDYTSKIAAFEMNRIPHFGVMSTSRVEGNHSKLKNWLKNSRSDLYGLVEKLIPWWDDIYLSIIQHLEDEKQRTLYSFQTYLFEQVNRRIFRYPLGLLEKPLKQARDAVKNIEYSKEIGKEVEILPCNDTIETTLGLPCFHKLRDLLICRGTLTVDDFHQHWHIPYDTVDVQSGSQHILEPLTASLRKKKEKKIKGTCRHGNRRDTLHSERVMKNHRIRKAERKGSYRESGRSMGIPIEPAASSSQASIFDCQLSCRTT